MRLLAKLPLLFIEVLVSLVGFAAARWHRQSKVLRCNVEAVQGLPIQSEFSFQFARQVFEHQLHVIFEVVITYLFKLRPKLDNLESFADQIETLSMNKHPLVLVTGHHGNWEFGGYFCAQALKRPIYALAKSSKLNWLDRLITSMRNACDVNVIWTEGRGFMRQVGEILSQNEAVAFVMDQKPDSRKGVEVDFLGFPTTIVGGPASFACRSKAGVLYFSCIRLGWMRYHMLWDVIQNSDDYDDSDVSIEQLTAKMSRSIADGIRLYPEQWVWNYRRWNNEILTEANIKRKRRASYVNAAD